MKVKLRNFPKRRRKFREHWTVMLEWIGEKYATLPLIEHLFQAPSDGSGTFLACNLNDATWTRYTEAEGRALFNCLKDLCRKLRFSPYMRVQLHHDFKDWFPVKETKDGTLEANRGPKGWKRLAVYSRGKKPDFKRLTRKAPRSRKSQPSPKASANKKGRS